MSSKHTHTHTHLTALFPGLPRWAGTRKVKPIWILPKQETVRSSGISWAKCKSAPRSRQTTMPAPHHSVFLQARCPSCRPTNSVKALKACHPNVITNLLCTGQNIRHSSTKPGFSEPVPQVEINACLSLFMSTFSSFWRTISERWSINMHSHQSTADCRLTYLK